MRPNVLLLAALGLAACNNSEPAKNEPTTDTAEKKQEQPTAPAETPKKNEGAVLVAKDNVVNLEGTDTMKFNATEIRVTAGSKVTVNLKHVGKLDAAVMGHNFVLLKKGVELGKFAGDAMKAKEQDYIPSKDDVIAHTKVIGGGESTSIEFDAPAPGTYDFLCSFPGHYAMMKGKFVVEE